MSSTSFDDALALFDGLSPTDQLRFNFEVASRLKKGGKTGKTKSKTSSSSDTEKPKRKAAPGTLAWMAFVKHCKTTMPDRFEDCTKEPERLTICKAIRSEDSAAYDAFTKDFVDNYSEAEEAEPAAAPAPAAAAPAAKKTPVKAAKAAASAPAAPAASEAVKTAVTPAKTTKAKTPAAPTKAAKAAKAAAPAPAMPQIEVGGETYFHDRSNNGLYNLMDDGSLGAWVGFYQPTDAEEPIRYTESPTDE
jgi:hypothetical protein